MARREVVTFTCDRCGETFDPPATPGDPTWTSHGPVLIHLALLFRAGSGNGDAVKELCQACTALLNAFLAGGEVIDVSGLSKAAQEILGGFARDVSAGPPPDTVTVDVSAGPPPVGSVGAALLEAQRRTRSG